MAKKQPVTKKKATARKGKATPKKATAKKSKKTSIAQDVYRLPAIEVQQGEGRRLYSFAVDGKVVHDFATVSRIGRDESKTVKGYQRPEVMSHISEIRKYIESENPMIPNALVVAFDSRVHFEPADGVGSEASYARHGTLVIPKVGEEEDKPGWLVDGQQRSAAIREARVESFPVCVSAFITDNINEQRSQFILVNSTKPLPKGLIHELLPSTAGEMPTHLKRKRFPATLLERLNLDEDSPFFGLIKTTTNPKGKIKDNSILKMIENSINYGALYTYWDSMTGQGDMEPMLAIIKSFWHMAAETFPEAWANEPRYSRLVHGAGIVSMGYMMDAMEGGCEDFEERDAHFRRHLGMIEPVCRWTSGNWEFAPGQTRRWNELQNTGKDIELLANYLLGVYRVALRKAG